MKRTFSLILAFVMIIGLFAGISVPVSAADGGEGSLYIQSHSDNDIVNGNEDVKIQWNKVPGADHYWLCVKDNVTGEKPVNQEVSGRTFTVDANTAFVVDGRTYKIYVAAMDKQGNVLEGASAWHAVYVKASVDSGPSLTYATPNLTSPEVDATYLSNRGCYYGVYDGEIDPNKDFTIRWENVFSDEYSISAVILRSQPDYGSTSENKAHEIVIKKLQTSRKYTIDKEDLEYYEGHWLKFVVQPIDDDGDYGLMGMYYFRIGSTPEPVPEPDPITNIFIGGVDTGYAAGDYFSKNKKACTCHGQGICLQDQSKCNCIQYVVYNGKTINLEGVQCIGWSRYLQVLLYGKHDKSDADFQKIYTNRTATSSGLKDALQNSAPGTHIRTLPNSNGVQHSLTILSANSTGVTITDCNHTARCQISVRSYTYAQLAEFVNSYNGVEYISVYSKNSNEQPDNTPVYAGDLNFSIQGTFSGKPGDVIELTLVLDTKVSYLQMRFESNLPYTIQGEGGFTFVPGEGQGVWYSPLAVDLKGTIATIRITIPADAKEGDAFTFKAIPVSAFKASEEELRVTAKSATITVENRVLLGDVNSDGVVDARDLLRLVKSLLGMNVQIDKKAADLDGSGTITAIDLLRLITKIIG